MAYVAPTSRSTGEFITAAIWNQDVVDNVTFLANPPACRITKAAAQSIANATLTAITFDTERFDTDSMHSTVTNNTRITFNTAGLYVITGCIQFASNATGYRYVEILLNNSTEIGIHRQPATGADQTNISIATTWKAAAADFIELRVYQTSGGALNVDKAGSNSPDFSATWIGLG